jgi:hypothetical protein
VTRKLGNQHRLPTYEDSHFGWLGVRPLNPQGAIASFPLRLMLPSQLSSKAKYFHNIRDDFVPWEMLEEQLKGHHACFFCLGVSSVGMSEREYGRTTYDLTLQAATVLSRHHPLMTFCHVSGTGTDSTEQGRIMWARMKGRTENHLTHQILL